MNPGQLAVLTALSNVKRSRSDDLAITCDMDKARAREHVYRLVRKGYARRVCPCIVTITEKGREALRIVAM